MYILVVVDIRGAGTSDGFKDWRRAQEKQINFGPDESFAFDAILTRILKRVLNCR